MTALSPTPPPFDVEEMLVGVLVTHDLFPSNTLQIVSLFEARRHVLTAPFPMRMATEKASIIAAFIHMKVPDADARVLLTFGEEPEPGRAAVAAVRSILDEPDTYAFNISLNEWVNLDDGSSGSYADLKSHPSALAALFDSGRSVP